VFSPSRRPSNPRHFPTRRSSDLKHDPLPLVCLSRQGRPQNTRTSGHMLEVATVRIALHGNVDWLQDGPILSAVGTTFSRIDFERSEEHTSELQSRENLVCRLLLE